MEKNVIDEKRYERLSMMIQGTIGDVQMVVKIIDKCDIPNSFVHILLLMGCKYDHTQTLSTPLIQSTKVQDYVKLLYKTYNQMPLGLSLDDALNLYGRHCEYQNIPIEPLVIKYITLNYNTSNKDEYFSKLKGTPLKPRKNVGRRNNS